MQLAKNTVLHVLGFTIQYIQYHESHTLFHTPLDVKEDT